MKCLVTANTNASCIYEFNKNQLTLIKEISHPENKLRSSELGSDAPGRYKSNGSNRGTYSPRTEIDEVYVEAFARELANELNLERTHHVYDELIVIMPAQMEGLVYKHLNKNVKELIKLTLHKNIMHLSEKELVTFIHDNRK